MTLFEKILKLEKEAAEFGFRWESVEQIMQQIKSECGEINEHLMDDIVHNPAALQDEIGDLLHAVFSLCVFCQFDPETTLQNTLEKFARRLQAVKVITQEKQRDNLQGQPFTELMAIWNQAKNRVG